MSVTSNKLYNLTLQQQEINALIDDAYGEITPEIEKQIAIFEMNEVGRAFTMKAIYEMLIDKSDLAKGKAKEFSKLAKQWEFNAKAIKKYIADYLVRSGKNKLETGTESISKRKTPDKIEVISEKEIPDKYKRFKCTLNSRHIELLKQGCEFAEIDMPELNIEVDKASIKAEYKNSKLEVKGTKITSGFTITMEG